MQSDRRTIRATRLVAISRVNYRAIPPIHRRPGRGRSCLLAGGSRLLGGTFELSVGVAAEARVNGWTDVSTSVACTVSAATTARRYGDFTPLGDCHVTATTLT